MASRNRLLILVASAISLSEMPRISRSRRSSSPNDASSEYGCCVCSGIEGQIVIRRPEALNAAPEIHRGRRVLVDHAQIAGGQGAQKRGGGGARRLWVHDQRLADWIAVRSLPIGGQDPQLFGGRPVAPSDQHEILLAQPLVDEQRFKDPGVLIEEKRLDQCLSASLGGGNALAEGELA